MLENLSGCQIRHVIILLCRMVVPISTSNKMATSLCRPCYFLTVSVPIVLLCGTTLKTVLTRRICRRPPPPPERLNRETIDKSLIATFRIDVVSQ